MKNLREVIEGECRWMDDKPMCCAKQTVKSSSWCRVHYRMVHHRNQSQAKGQIEFYARNVGHRGAVPPTLS